MDNGQAAPKWHVVRVNARHEKSVSQMLSLAGHAAFLPLSKRVHIYGRRSREYQLPLFPGYVFCQAMPCRISSVSQLPSILEIVGIRGVPAVVPDEEIDSLRLATESRAPLHSWPYLNVGEKVRVTGGGLAGVTGVLLDSKSKSMRIILSINLLRRSVLLEISRANVERIPAE